MMASHFLVLTFVTTTVVAVFAFLSVVMWVQSRAGERKARDRFALLKSLAEDPGENAAQVLQMLREQEQRQAERKDREDRRGFLAGGVVCIATGIGFSIMMATMTAKPGVWTIGLMIALIGVALVPFGLPPRRAAKPPEPR